MTFILQDAPQFGALNPTCDYFAAMQFSNLTIAGTMPSEIAPRILDKMLILPYAVSPSFQATRDSIINFASFTRPIAGISNSSKSTFCSVYTLHALISFQAAVNASTISTKSINPPHDLIVHVHEQMEGLVQVIGGLDHFTVFHVAN
ncbi:MAG TPA: hypothetical protein VEF34_02325 [Syntrophobacteraceae bacterium]|nr:hypothetical protein [Syntrophobacteraceae bacterium]